MTFPRRFTLGSPGCRSLTDFVTPKDSRAGLPPNFRTMLRLAASRETL